MILEEGKTVSGMLISCIEGWKPEYHWDDLKIGCGTSCISVEGLPLNMWNQYSFELIGSYYGGLVEVAEETRDQEHFEHAFLKVKSLAENFFSKKP